MPDITSIAQLVLLVVYIVVAIIINGKLKTQNKSQSELMDKMKQYADLFKVEEFKKYQELMGDNIRMELDKKRAKELEEQKTVIEEDFKRRSKEGLTQLLIDIKALTALAFNLVYESPDNTRIDNLLNGMTSESQFKQGLLEFREESKAEWRAAWADWLKKDPNYSPSMLAAVLARMGTSKKPEDDK